MTLEKAEAKTLLLFDLAAEIVVGEAESLARGILLTDLEENKRYLLNRLKGQLERHPNNFTKRLFGKGNAGRDFLYCFFRHWMAARMLDYYKVARTPEIERFGNGSKIKNIP